MLLIQCFSFPFHSTCVLDPLGFVIFRHVYVHCFVEKKSWAAYSDLSACIASASQVFLSVSLHLPYENLLELFSFIELFFPFLNNFSVMLVCWSATFIDVFFPASNFPVLWSLSVPLPLISSFSWWHAWLQSERAEFSSLAFPLPYSLVHPAVKGY